MTQIKAIMNLSTFIKQIMAARGFSYRDIEARSGGRISHGYVNSLVRGTHKNPTVEKISALAKGLGVPEDTLTKVVKGILLKEKDDPAFVVVEEAIREIGIKLTKEEKEKVIYIVKNFLKLLIEISIEMVRKW